MLNYFIEKGHHQNDRSGQLLTFNIELHVCMNPMGMGLELAKIIISVTTDFYSFFLKGIIIAHEIKINS